MFPVIADLLLCIWNIQECNRISGIEIFLYIQRAGVKREERAINKITWRIFSNHTYSPRISHLTFENHCYRETLECFCIPQVCWGLKEWGLLPFRSVQFSSVTQSCPTLCDPMNSCMPGLPVHHQLPESTQTHVHWVGDAIQPSYLLSSPSPSALSLSQHQGLFQWISSLHQVAEFQLQHQSFQWTPRSAFSDTL